MIINGKEVDSRSPEYKKHYRKVYHYKDARRAWVYRLLNPEKLAEYQKSYYLKHKKTIARRKALKYMESKNHQKPQ